jgi:hypothetical protein
VGVVRRGTGVPILPPADGSAPATLDPTPQTVPVNAWLGRTVAPTTDVFRLPDVRSPWVGRMNQGQQVAVASQWSGFYAIIMGDGSWGYVPQTHVELLPYLVKSVGPAAAPPSAAPSPNRTVGAFPEAQMTRLTPPNGDLARAVIEEAFAYNGVPYVWGGNTRSGVDCSGLVKNCYAAQGVYLPRRASEQARVGIEVPLDQMQPGDRVYFSVKKAYDHTGIYLGNGYFIHASRSRKKVGVDHLSTPLYGNSLSAARRL